MNTRHRQLFFALQGLMIAFSLLTHGWLVWRAWLEDGILWAAGYLLLFVCAEAYWAYRSLLAEGVTAFFICNAICATWWIALFVGRRRLQRHIMPAT